MHIASIGIDLGKNTFHLIALGERNKILLRKKFSRPQLLAYTAKLPRSLIGLEACAGSHFLGAALREQGHQVRLMIWRWSDTDEAANLRTAGISIRRFIMFEASNVTY